MARAWWSSAVLLIRGLGAGDLARGLAGLFARGFAGDLAAGFAGLLAAGFLAARAGLFALGLAGLLAAGFLGGMTLRALAVARCFADLSGESCRMAAREAGVSFAQA